MSIRVDAEDALLLLLLLGSQRERDSAISCARCNSRMQRGPPGKPFQCDACTRNPCFQIFGCRRCDVDVCDPCVRNILQRKSDQAARGTNGDVSARNSSTGGGSGGSDRLLTRSTPTRPANIHVTTSAGQYQQLLLSKEGKFATVIFMGDERWGSLRMIPLFEELARKHSNVVFMIIDAGDQRSSSWFKQYQILHTEYSPHFVFIHNCNLVSKFSGADGERLINGVDQLLFHAILVQGFREIAEAAQGGRGGTSSSNRSQGVSTTTTAPSSNDDTATAEKVAEVLKQLDIRAIHDFENKLYLIQGLRNTPALNGKVCVGIQIVPESTIDDIKCDAEVWDEGTCSWTSRRFHFSKLTPRIQPDKLVALGDAIYKAAYPISLQGAKSKSLRRVVSLFKLAAEQDHVGAQKALGVCYDKGYGVEKSPLLAYAWYLKSAENGHRGAMLNVGIFLATGVNGGDIQLTKAAEWIQKAADKHCPAAALQLAQFYSSGSGVPKNPRKELGLLIQAYRDHEAKWKNGLGNTVFCQNNVDLYCDTVCNTRNRCGMNSFQCPACKELQCQDEDYWSRPSSSKRAPMSHSEYGELIRKIEALINELLPKNTDLGELPASLLTKIRLPSADVRRGNPSNEGQQPVLRIGDRATYKKTGETVTIKSICPDLGGRTFYTIELPNGSERDTTVENLSTDSLPRQSYDRSMSASNHRNPSQYDGDSCATGQRGSRHYDSFTSTSSRRTPRQYDSGISASATNNQRIPMQDDSSDTYPAARGNTSQQLDDSGISASNRLPRDIHHCTHGSPPSSADSSVCHTSADHLRRLRVGESVWYKRTDEAAKVIIVHLDDPNPPFYTIRIRSSGNERQTQRGGLWIPDDDNQPRSSSSPIATASDDDNLPRSSSSATATATATATASMRQPRAMTSITTGSSTLPPTSVYVLQSDLVSVNKKDVIGQGSFGRVYGGSYKWPNKTVGEKKVAFKNIPNPHGSKHPTGDGILDEMRINHPHLLQVFGSVVVKGELFIMMERLACCLTLVIRDEKTYPTLPMRAVLLWLTDITQGLLALHRAVPSAIIHRDLKSSNVLLTEKPTPNFTALVGASNYCRAKICDFGMAKVIDSTSIETYTSGALRWKAPETMHSNTLSLSSDVYSYGMIVYELVTRKFPFEMGVTGDSQSLSDPAVTGVLMKSAPFELNQDLIDAGVTEQQQKDIHAKKLERSFGSRRPNCDPAIISAGVDSQLIEIMTSCWADDPSQRPSMEQVLKKLQDLQHDGQGDQDEEDIFKPPQDCQFPEMHVKCLKLIIKFIPNKDAAKGKVKEELGRCTTLVECQRLLERLKLEFAPPVQRMKTKTDRQGIKVLIIGPGFGMKKDKSQLDMVVNAGFQVIKCFPTSPVDPGFNMSTDIETVIKKIDETKPHVLVAASKGGAYIVEIWRRMKAGTLRNIPTLLINVHPHCWTLDGLPQNTPIVLVQSDEENEPGFKCKRGIASNGAIESGKTLEGLLRSGSPGQCMLYYTVNSATRPHKDRHVVKSLLENDCLPRLIDSLVTQGAKPVFDFPLSSGCFLSERRQNAERYLGFEPRSLVRFWQPNAADILQDVMVGSGEFNAVSAIFKAEPQGRKFYNSTIKMEGKTIARIRRIQNPGLHRIMDAKYKPLQTALQSAGVDYVGGVHTRWLFHATGDSNTMDSIIGDATQGFAPLLTSRHLWGKGCYFARDASYPKYNVPDWTDEDGNSVLLLCLVSVGVPCVGEETLSHLPTIHNGKIGSKILRYSSFVDSLANPEIFVVCDASAIYPAYAIHYH